ncbi:AEC family transporter [Mangrovibrevibacter kandeliae]|uniref:AEC family transporter n=1 Tax=Mangrovibrevibacter kandeliae TaxID=2968473 RepID=UPI002117B6A6|nr:MULTISPECIES: AEC family transporter [unclassified Aurantimonas]MCQ8783818.1 AEC family transporter [Aurantimonas sp. CSK15Z-1]MCW4116540.1 AEC family transporter [Aurantimonas sp. MSK8Z-1]
MQLILNVVIPIFGLIAIGYLFARIGLLSEATGESLGSFVFMVGVPVLLFRTVASADFNDGNPLLLWLVYFGAVAVTWTLSTVLVRKLTSADRRSGVIAGISASFANTAFIAIPAVDRAYGELGLHPLFMVISIHMPVMMLTSSLLIERAAARDARDQGIDIHAARLGQVLLRVGKGLAGNALVIGLASGFLWHLTGLALPGPIDQITELLARTAGPIALFSIGMSLNRFSVRGDLLAPAITSFLSLLLMPALVYLFGRNLLPPLWLKAAVVTAACPAGVNAYVLAVYFRSGEKLAAAAILVSTLGAVLTLSGWLAILG